MENPDIPKRANNKKKIIPKEFLIVENIPNTALGKPDRVKAQLLFTDKQR